MAPRELAGLMIPIFYIHTCFPFYLPPLSIVFVSACTSFSLLPSLLLKFLLSPSISLSSSQRLFHLPPPTCLYVFLFTYLPTLLHVPYLPYLFSSFSLFPFSTVTFPCTMTPIKLLLYYCVSCFFFIYRIFTFLQPLDY